MEDKNLGKLIEIGCRIVNLADGRHRYEDIKMLVEKEIKNYDLQVKDLINFVNYLGNVFKERNGNFLARFNERLLGRYTGVLLDYLTLKNGKFEIVIEGISLNYLFYEVRNAGRIVIKNCRGNGILENAGCGGSIDEIIVINSKGHIGNGIGEGGKIGSILGFHLEGNVFNDIGRAGDIKNVWISHFNGNVANRIAKNGKIKRVIIEYGEGEEVANEIAENGEIEELYIFHLNAKKFLSRMGKVKKLKISKRLIRRIFPQEI